VLWHFKRIPVYFLGLVLVGSLLLGGCGLNDLADPVPTLSYKIMRTYHHDPDAFTQGLVIDMGVLYESTGNYGKSTLRRVDLSSGDILQLYALPAQFFGEGITVFDNKIIQLTWKSGVGFVYEKNSFTLLQIFRYPGEGWGITQDGKNLIMSDGSSTIRFLNPETFEEERRINVTDESGPVTLLNELEYVRGTIYANVWKTNRIALINPETGKVTGWLDLTGIMTKELPQKKDSGVLNGIAYDSGKEALYITGKNWPLLFQIELLINK
jgi:glutamine cyclotransferase